MQQTLTDFLKWKILKSFNFLFCLFCIYEPRHDKSNKMACAPVKSQISQGIRRVWSESSLSAWRNWGSVATHWAHSEDSDQTGRMPRLNWVFAGRPLILLVLSCCGSYHFPSFFSSSWCDGLTVTFYSGTPWTFHLTFQLKWIRLWVKNMPRRY